MTSRERILAACRGEKADRVPLTTWCFGFPAPEHLRWRSDGRETPFWYSLRMEHIHTLGQAWTLEDDFARVRAWLSAGIDDLLDVSVPWSASPGVSWADRELPAGAADACSVLVREYQTPAGPVRHEVRRTGEAVPPGWVVQPPRVELFEDYNIPRAVRHAVSGPADVPAVAHLYRGPDELGREWFVERMARVGQFAAVEGAAVQAWSAFGMDAAVWLAGTQGAVMLAMDYPDAFGRLIEAIAQADLERTELAAAHPSVDLVVQRGWYSSTDFWSPELFDRYVYPHTRRLAEAAHRRGKLFAYVMTTGVERLGPRLADAGVDVLYFFDPVQDRVPLAAARRLAERMTLAGGTNSLSLQAPAGRIEGEVRAAMEALAPTRRFILHPVDALFPDTPWQGVDALIRAWRQFA